MVVKERKTVHDGYFEMEEVTYVNENGDEISREVLIKNNAVAGLIYDTVKNKYIFVEQFRAGKEDKSIEIVAGTIDVEGEDEKDTMIREVEEETGYKVDHIEYIMKIETSPAYTPETIDLFYCEVSEKISEGGGVGDENIKIIEIDDLGVNGKLIIYDEDYVMKDMIQLKDPKSIIAVSWKENKDLLMNVMGKVMDISDLITSSKLRSL